MRVLLAGGLGAVGRACIEALVADGHPVVASTRKAERMPELAATGAVPVQVDAFDSEALRRCVLEASPDVVMHQLTALPKKVPNPRRVAQELDLSNRLRGEVMPVLARAAVEAGATRLVAQIWAFVYGPEGGLKSESDPLYEPCPPAFGALVDGVRRLEDATLGAGIDGVVLRYGYFYGPGTYYAPDGDLCAQVKKRRFPVFGGGPEQFSFIHVADAAAAAVTAALGGPPGIYNIVDDEPVTMGEFLDWYAPLLGAKQAYRIPVWLGQLGGGPYARYLMMQQRGASNAKARAELGLHLSHPSWRETMKKEHTEGPRTRED